MDYMIKKTAFFILTCSLLIQIGCTNPQEAMQLPLHAMPLTITTSKGRVDVLIEVARTDQERERGLMFRAKLPPRQGMLFVFEKADMLTFWMQNTPEPLDIIFISEAGKIATIASGEANSSAQIPSSAMVQYVLEIARGEASRLGIQVGDTLSHPFINGTIK
jgi:uncharacterized protein